MAKPEIIAVTEIYAGEQLVGKKAKVIKDPIDYVSWAIGIGIAIAGIWIMVIPMESWGFFG
jgi:hypothetical protein